MMGRNMLVDHSYCVYGFKINVFVDCNPCMAK